MVLHAATSGAGVAQVLRGRRARGPGRRVGRTAVTGVSRIPARRTICGTGSCWPSSSPPRRPACCPRPRSGTSRAALAATGTDALVYLLPRDDAGPGVAVIVDQDGTVRRLPLAGLYAGGASPVERVPPDAAGGRGGRYAGRQRDDAARQAWLDGARHALRMGLAGGHRAAAGRGSGAQRESGTPDRPRARSRAWPGALACRPPAGAGRMPASRRCSATLPRPASSSRPPGAALGRGRRPRCSFPTPRNRCTSPPRASATCSLPITQPQRCSGSRGDNLACADPGYARRHPRRCARRAAAGRLARGLAAALRLPWAGPGSGPRLEPLAR